MQRGRACFKKNSSLHISSVKAAVFYEKISVYPGKFPNDLFQSFASNFLYNYIGLQLLISATGQTIITAKSTNSLSSLHISIHHSIIKFCASLHVKTSPA